MRGHDNPMVDVVALDFDGVLHRGTTGTFRHLPLFCDWLRGRPDTCVVLSTDWRLSEPLDELREYFPEDLRERILGETPDFSDWCGAACREQEILAWLSTAPRRIRKWAALDDTASLFHLNCPHLVLTNAREGISTQDLDRLTGKLA